MNNNEPDTLPDPAIGYIFQNDIVALKQAFHCLILIMPIFPNANSWPRH
ncbi:hypothetical protein BvCmsKSP013_02594 [Escherichia coli]|nr:hypothetical protein JNE072951_4471 [Escherichia coli]BDQ78924.1 hypothetical protein JNE110611_4563 [Escherichia coli]BDQ84114.1 hypothetical protein PV0671_4425 [Escherichia coli]BDQ89228.1 hypothetical protein JNE071324_4281 [Escherichia coli]BDQ94549.1 hypothetical protein PV0197_4127 [Escherichia coli]